MTRPGIVVIEPAEGPSPPHWPAVVLASALESADFHVHRLQAHELAVSEATEWTLERAPSLVFASSRFPVAFLRDLVLSVSSTPVCLHGPFALDRFELTECRFAFVGSVRLEAATLAHRLLRSGDAIEPAKMDTIPRLLVREPGETGGTWLLSRDWTPPSASEILAPVTSAPAWEYLGPRRRPSDVPQLGRLWAPEPDAPNDLMTSLESRTLRGTPEYLIPPPLDPRYVARDDGPEGQPFGISDHSSLYEWKDSLPVEQIVELLRVQATHFLDQGIRDLALQMRDPFPVVAPLAHRLAESDKIPRSIQISPAVPSLKRVTSLPESLQPWLALGISVQITDVPFLSFDDRNLRLLGHGATHWENRWVARLLQEAEGFAEGRILALAGHELTLIDPWSRLQDVVDSLLAVEEDAPFLKTAVHPGSRTTILSRYSAMGRRAEADGLLERGPGPSGWTSKFAHPEMARYLELAHQGMVPLLETIGRMKLPPAQREEMTVEARFRWMRDLAVHLQRSSSSSTEAEESWGRVLGNVVRELATDFRKEGSP